MEWYLALILIVGSFLVLMFTGIPVAFSFIVINLICAFLFWGGFSGLEQLVVNMASSVTSFILLPLPLFIVMGEVLFFSGIAPNIMDTVDKLLGKLPGRLSLVAVGSGTVLAALTGAPISSCALLGTVLLPEMEKRGYKKAMSLGPIMGSGGLALMIPPSTLAVVLGAIGDISIAPILIATIFPGLIMAILYVGYIIPRCWLQPELAPSYEISPIPILDKLVLVAKYILPVGFIIFLVTGVIVVGIATPSEAAATGALGTFILAAAYRKMNWAIAKKSIFSSFQISVMLMFIISGAMSFSLNLAASGAVQGLSEIALNLPLPPVAVVICMMLVIFLLGCITDAASIIMICAPIFVPIVRALGFDPVWFAVIFLINLDIGGLTPPFGMVLFTMKGVATRDTTMSDIYKAVWPWVGIDALAIALIMIFPMTALWLPSIALAK